MILPEALAIIAIVLANAIVIAIGWHIRPQRDGEGFKFNNAYDRGQDNDNR